MLDPALEHDPESDRVANQIFEGLVDLAPGRTRVVPGLATDWQASRDGRTWTFFLRRGVKFQDGTALNAAAVCFNFERWYGFTGSLQHAAWCWAMVFRRLPPSGATARFPSRRASIAAVRTLANSPFGSVCSAARRHSLRHRRFPTFGIASPTALRKYDADEVRSTRTGLPPRGDVRHRSSDRHRARSCSRPWRQGREVVLVRNPHYWGRKAKLDRLVFRVIPDREKRLQALQRGTIHGLDAVLAGAVGAISHDPKLKIRNGLPGTSATSASTRLCRR